MLSNDPIRSDRWSIIRYLSQSRPTTTLVKRSAFAGCEAEVTMADGVNAKIAVFLTNIVGSMWCAYVFAVIALIGLGRH